MGDPEWDEVGRRLRVAREAAGLTQEAVAARLEEYGIVVSKTMVSNWERGDPVAEPRYLFALEEITGSPAGSISQHAGYLPREAAAGFVDWEEAIVAEVPADDPRTADLSRSVVEMVRVAVRQSRQIRRGRRED